MKALLEVREVAKSFSSVRAVDGISFEVRPGEVFGFLGPNGAGKTTTLRMIMQITRPDRGEVLFDGRTELDRQRIGYLPEERGLFEDAGVLDTLIYLAMLRGMTVRDARDAARAWLGRLGLGDRTASKVGALSKGNQQKVQFAGAILHRPSLVVLDEPFAGLDPLNQELFLSLIRELRAGGSAVLLSAHHLNLVERLCNRFLLISRGRSALEGTLEEIRHEVAGGIGEVLALEVRGKDGEPCDEGSLRARVSQVVGAESHRIGALPNGALEVQLFLPPGADLSPLIAAISAGHAIARVEMRSLSLHEIYVRAVGTDQPAPPHEEEPSLA